MNILQVSKFVGRRRNRKKSSLGSTANIQEEQRNDAWFASMPQPERDYSNNHEIEAPRNRQRRNEKSTNFRPPPDGLMMGRYKLCPRLEYFIFLCTSTV